MAINLFKYPMAWQFSQVVRCKAVRILDIQVQDRTPVLWAITDDDAQMREIMVVMQGTGPNVFSQLATNSWQYITTLQASGLVYHCFINLHDTGTKCCDFCRGSGVVYVYHSDNTQLCPACKGTGFGIQLSQYNVTESPWPKEGLKVLKVEERNGGIYCHDRKSE